MKQVYTGNGQHYVQVICDEKIHVTRCDGALARLHCRGRFPILPLWHAARASQPRISAKKLGNQLLLSGTRQVQQEPDASWFRVCLGSNTCQLKGRLDCLGRVQRDENQGSANASPLISRNKYLTANIVSLDTA